MEVTLEAVKRTTSGKNESNRTRAAGFIPAILYGAQKEGDAIQPVQLTVDPKPFLRILHSKSGFNTLITLKVDGDADARVLVREVQRDPVTGHPLHADFYRVNMDRRIKVAVPIILIGEARGVKVDGGVLDFVTREIMVECLPAEIPSSIELDVTALGIGDAVHVRDITANASWHPVTDADAMLVHVVSIKASEETAAAVAAVAEPEVAKKGKPDAAKDAKAGDTKKPDAKKPDAKKADDKKGDKKK